MKKTFTGIAMALSTALTNTTSAANFLGPSPYLSFADSPFYSTAFTYFFLEDFEDHLLNTSGVSVNKGEPGYGNVYVDSVDADDGVIDGSGLGGTSWALYNDVTDYVSFVFDQDILGSLPTHAGLVWTDVHPGYGHVTFTAFDENGLSLGSLSADLGDGTTLGGGTAEDRLFGIINMGGISSIQMSTTFGVTWEVDHLQYGASAAVPEPMSVVLLATCGILFAGRRYFADLGVRS